MNIQIRKLGWGFGLCNQHCRHCYNASSLRKSIPRYIFAELKLVADKVCPYIRDINYGTGEFGCNPNTLVLAEYIADEYPQVAQCVTSNGYTIVSLSPQKVKRLFHDVDISIDFPEETRHNEFRGHKKAWEWVNNGIAILQELRVPRTIVTCVTALTREEDIRGLLDMARQFGASWRINWFRSVGRGLDAKNELQLTPQRAWEVIRFLSDKVTFQCLDSVFAGPLGLPSIPCPAGHKSARIHQDMSVTAYPFLKGPEWTAGNILEEGVDLQTIYNSPAFQRLRNRIVPECKGCPFQKTCAGGCVTRAALHNGGIDKRDDFCPLAADIRFEDIKLEMKKEGDLVHDGYLCTTICRPKESPKKEAV